MWCCLELMQVVSESSRCERLVFLIAKGVKKERKLTLVFYIFVSFKCIQGDRCGIFGSNCPQWLTAMEVNTVFPIFMDHDWLHIHALLLTWREKLSISEGNSLSGWITVMLLCFLDVLQACNSHAITYVPLYDTLGMFSLCQ